MMGDEFYFDAPITRTTIIGLAMGLVVSSLLILALYGLSRL